MAVSIELLDFYRALFERSCDAITAIAAALHTFYTRRGYVLLTKKVSCHPLYITSIDEILTGYTNQRCLSARDGPCRAVV